MQARLLPFFPYHFDRILLATWPRGVFMSRGPQGGQAPRIGFMAAAESTSKVNYVLRWSYAGRSVWQESGFWPVSELSPHIATATTYILCCFSKMAPRIVLDPGPRTKSYNYKPCTQEVAIFPFISTHFQLHAVLQSLVTPKWSKLHQFSPPKRRDDFREGKDVSTDR